MDAPQEQKTPVPSSNSQIRSRYPPTIQKIPLDEQPNEHDQTFSRICDGCGVRHNEIHDFCKIIVIKIDDSGDAFCDVCLGKKLSKQSQEVKVSEQKYIYHKEYETSMTKNDKQLLFKFEKDPNTEETKEEVEQLQAEEKELDRALRNLQGEKWELQEKVLQIEQREEKFWQDLNKFEKRAIKLEEKSFMARCHRNCQKESLEELSKTSIVQKFFQIEIKDSYAQICGLVLGKRAGQVDVNWEETNAALGHLLLAFNYLSLKYGIPYTRFLDIKIEGHLSEVKTKAAGAFYPIAYSGKESEKVFGIVLENLLGELAALTELIQEVENIEYTEELKLPFQILKKEGKIVDLCINPTKIEEKHRWTQWTKAMRYFLIDIKHILTISLLSDPYL